MHQSILPGIMPDLGSVKQAFERLSDLFEPTPLKRSVELEKILGVPVFLKLENLQVTGSFKVRGAFTVLDRMSKAEQNRGVVASSAGNHGLGVAWASNHFGTPATIFVPKSAPDIKKQGILDLGAEVNDEAQDYDHAMELAITFSEEKGIPFINPCLGVDLLAGQGTVALEILQQLSVPKAVVLPVGGGGLLGGMGAVLRSLTPDCTVIGSQSENTAAMSKSFYAKEVVSIDSEPTLADGLAGQIDEDALAIGLKCLDVIYCEPEKQIASAISWLHKNEAIRAEGAGAVSVATALNRRPFLTSGKQNGPVVIVVSGCNIDANRYSTLLALEDRNEALRDSPPSRPMADI